MGISCDNISGKRKDKKKKDTNKNTKECNNMSDAPIFDGTNQEKKNFPINANNDYKTPSYPIYPIYPQFKPEINVPELINIRPVSKPQNIIEDKKQEIIKQTKNFYDLILDFSKFEQLKEGGWKIIWGEKGKEKYERCKNLDNVVVGVIGNKNKGKSFLLSKFIDKQNYSKNEHGFLVTTKGISANFPILEEEGDNQTNVITLDTAGKDNPLLDMTNNIENPNGTPKRKKYENEQIKNIARDQRISEIVLSDFIIQEADVLITVLEQLSFAEQEMLKNLLNQLKSKKSGNNRVNPKKLIVIHNLMNLVDVNSIQKFIDNTLLNSFTFKLSKRQLQFIKKENGIDDTKKYCYIQKTKEIDNLEIYHLIFGNDSENNIRREFNEPAIRFIRDAIKTATQKKFDLIEDFKQFITINSQKYLNGKGLPPDSLLIEKEKETDIPTGIVLKDKDHDISLKGVLVNSNGIADFYASIEPNYSSRICEEKDQKDKYYLEIIFEIFGKLNDIKISKGMQKMKYVITIEGNVLDPNEVKCKDIQGNLKYTGFFFQIFIDKFFLMKNEPNIKDNCKYNITDIDENNKDIQKDEEFGVYYIKLPINLVKINKWK